LNYQNNYVELKLVVRKFFAAFCSLFLKLQNYFDGPTKLFFRSVSSKILDLLAKSSFHVHSLFYEIKITIWIDSISMV